MYVALLGIYNTGTRYRFVGAHLSESLVFTKKTAQYPSATNCNLNTCKPHMLLDISNVKLSARAFCVLLQNTERKIRL